jgi:hypothetical protein
LPSILLEDEAARRYLEFDRAAEAAAESWQARHVVLPSLLPREYLSELGYDTSFTEHLTDVEPRLRYPSAQDPLAALTPAACLALYPAITFAECNSMYTSRVRTYRYESGSFNSVSRLWEFDVREFVLLGSDQFVRSSQSAILTWATEYFLARNITIETRPTSDHFTGQDRATSLLKKVQQLSGSKIELVIHCDGDALPIGSINYHGKHFLRLLGKKDTEGMVTGCVGFGLHRIASLSAESQFTKRN